MLLATAAIILGFPVLVWGADRFVAGAAGLAHNLGVSSLLIGLTVVGFGTSAPEILVSTMSSIQGNPGLAVGNAIGSNIANIGLILGATALICPLLVKSDILRLEYPLLLGASVVAFLLMSDERLDSIDGAILLGGLVIVMTLVVRIGLSRPKTDPMVAEFEAEIPRAMNTLAAVAWLLVGLALLLLSSQLLVWGAVEIAHIVGVSDLVIGLTIVAIGTSLPELAASIASALRKEPDIAIGNVIGSNMYNLLAVLCVPGLVAPTRVDSEVLTRDVPVMLLLTIALFAMGWGRGGHGKINRLEGVILLFAFAGYLAWVVHDALDAQVA